MQVFKPPHRPPHETMRKVRLFLAGSIDMGKADDWQSRVENRLADLDVEIFNPRRVDWDNSWKQEIENPQFRGQVNWELDYLADADIKVFYFDPGGKAPITLLELGLNAASGECVVFCPRAYWRAGNVQVICDRYEIPLFEEDFDAFIGEIRGRIDRKMAA